MTYEERGAARVAKGQRNNNNREEKRGRMQRKLPKEKKTSHHDAKANECVRKGKESIQRCKGRANLSERGGGSFQIGMSGKGG